MIPAPREGGGGTKAPALTYVVTCAGLVVLMVASVAGGFCGEVLSGFRIFPFFIFDF